eukprot:TRINITY_DN10966_c0_g1_i5.p1 TRINITY_DN10966_c0_g1~~TRINITY_DN10966_c0_g1_i5.p1  ORF type:complete len:1045 (-),score=277.94 TRINITY_DN10966_c0_g1_i5:169-3222(-)
MAQNASQPGSSQQATTEAASIDGGGQKTTSALRAKLRAANRFASPQKDAAGGAGAADVDGPTDKESRLDKRAQRRERLKNTNRVANAHAEAKPIGGAAVAAAAAAAVATAQADPEKVEFTVSLTDSVEHGLSFRPTTTPKVCIVESCDKDLSCFQLGVRAGDCLLAVDGGKVDSLSDDELQAALQRRPVALSFEAAKEQKDRDLLAPEGTESIGLGLGSFPPGPVMLSMVQNGSWGQNCGLVAGDEVRFLDGFAVAAMTAAELKSKLRQRPLRLRVRLLQDGPREFKFAETGADALPLGLFLQFAAAATELALAGVEDNSWAKNAGLKPGDRIVAINGTECSSLQSESQMEDLLKERPLKLKVQLQLQTAQGALAAGGPGAQAASALQSPQAAQAAQPAQATQPAQAAQGAPPAAAPPAQVAKPKDEAPPPPVVVVHQVKTAGAEAVPPQKASILSNVDGMDPYAAADSPPVVPLLDAQDSHATPEDVLKDLHLELPEDYEVLMYPDIDVDAVARVAKAPNIVSPRKGAVRMALKLSAAEQKSAMIFPCSGVAASKFNFAPSVALKMFPDLYQGEEHHQFLQKEQARLAASAKRVGTLGAFAAHPARAAVAGPEFYEKEWSRYLPSVDSSGPPHVKVQISYEQMVAHRLGPMARQTDFTMSAQDYQNELLGGVLGYQVLQQGVEVPRSRPNYMEMLTPLAAEDGDDLPVEELQQALEINMKIRKAIQSDCLGMQQKIPRAAAAAQGGVASPLQGGIIEAAAPAPAKAPETEYHKISLKVVVIKAQGLPEADFMYSTSPYVIVSVVDGDPMSPAAAAGGDAEQAEAWYAAREQLHKRTASVENTTEPEWDSIITGDVRPRPESHVHFRVMDLEEYAHKDKPIGQAVVPLKEVMTNAWTAVRSIALVPFERKNQKRWAELTDARLIVRITWEGIAAQVKAPKIQFVEEATSASKAAQRLAARRNRSPGGASSADAPSPYSFDEAGVNAGANSRSRLAASCVLSLGKPCLRMMVHRNKAR